MKNFKIIISGALIWAVAFIVVSVFIGFKISTDSAAVKVITTAAVFIATLLLAKSLKINSQVNAVVYGIAWVAIGLILDAIITTRFTGWGIFYQPNVFISYLLIVITPLLTVRGKK